MGGGARKSCTCWTVVATAGQGASGLWGLHPQVLGCISVPAVPPLAPLHPHLPHFLLPGEPM